LTKYIKLIRDFFIVVVLICGALAIVYYLFFSGNTGPTPEQCENLSDELLNIVLTGTFRGTYFDSLREFVRINC